MPNRRRKVVMSLWAAGVLGGLNIACGGGPATPTPTGSAAGGAVRAEAAPTPRPGPPDIVVILADDMGYGDLGVYGNPLTKTPNIDRLAAGGSRFDAMYVPTPICAPSRASLLTGRYGIRNGVTWNNDTVLRTGEVTIAQLLKTQGYATGIVGKWHLGAKVTQMPLRLGFDFFYGMMSSPPGTNFVSGEAVTNDFPGMDFLTQRLTDEATCFIRKTPADKPLFLHLAHHAPHSPNVNSPAFVGSAGWGPYGDSVQELDWSVGQVMKTLEETGRDRNAFVVFLSDNGPVGAGSPGPLTYGKGNINEGGIRIPAIAWQPGRIPAGRLIKDPASTLDFFPTFAAMASAPLPARDYDGVDISQLLTGEVDRIAGKGLGGGREFYYFMVSEIAAVRSGKWKYVRPGFRDALPVLYDIESDPGETNSLRRFNPEVATALDKRITQFK
ncbi:MAG: sulfatase-like hydrolase/transferase [Vicinamibacteria bacterium]|nr:sulfatase-like hydrolase/transferase [Vicinamibacteria bacterium]